MDSSTSQLIVASIGLTAGAYQLSTALVPSFAIRDALGKDTPRSPKTESLDKLRTRLGRAIRRNKVMAACIALSALAVLSLVPELNWLTWPLVGLLLLGGVALIMWFVVLLLDPNTVLAVHGPDAPSPTRWQRLFGREVLERDPTPEQQVALQEGPLAIAPWSLVLVGAVIGLQAVDGGFLTQAMPILAVSIGLLLSAFANRDRRVLLQDIAAEKARATADADTSELSHPRTGPRILRTLRQRAARRR